MEQQVTPKLLEQELLEQKQEQEQQEYEDNYDRKLADSTEVLLKRQDDLVVYQHLVLDTLSNLDAEDSRTEGRGDTSWTVHYVDFTVKQLREDIAFLETEGERVAREIAVIDQLRRILDRSLGGIPLRPRDTLLEGLRESWWGWGSW